MLKNDKPKVSLGIPVFNESKYIAETINSLLSQTYENIEIIAIDNNSDDNSFNLLESLSKKDKRLKIFKNTKNIGMSKNFNLVFERSTGKYFAWIGAHDIYKNDFVEKLIHKLENTKDAAVAFTNISKIDSSGKKFEINKQTGFELYSSSSFLRQLKIPWKITGSGDIVMGIFNKKILSKTTLFLNSILWSDVFLIYQISKLGKIIRINEDLRLRRYFRDDEKKFENWEEKYKTIISRFRDEKKLSHKNLKNNYSFPVLSFGWKLILIMGLKKVYNPTNLLFSIYMSFIFVAFRWRAIIIEFKNYNSKNND